MVNTGTSYSPTVSSTTSYYVACYNTAQDCESDRVEVIATVNPNPTISASAACDAGNLTYTITVTTTDADQLTSDVGSVSGTAPNFTVSGITVGVDANLTATNSGTTCSVMELVTSPMCACPAGEPTVMGDTRCGPGTVNLSATSGANCDEIRWYDMATGGSLVNTGTSYSPTVSSTTSYYVACYNTAQDCESDRVEVIATVNPNPTISASAACDAGNLTYTITVTTTDADQLTSDVGSVSGTAPNFTVSGITVGVDANLTATNSGTTCSVMELVTSPMCACPAGEPTVMGDTRCGSGTVNLSATSGANCDEIRWYDMATGGSMVNTGTSYSPTVSSTTSYYVACYNTAQDCESDRVEVIATVNPNPTISASAACDAGNLTYTITVTTTDADQLTSDVGSVSGTAPNFTVSGVPAGTDANLTATNSGTTCSSMQTVTAPNCCVDPTANFVPVPGSCTDLTPNNDGRIVLTDYTDATHYTVRLATDPTPADDAADFGGAGSISGTPQDILTGVSNAGETYIVRIYNGASSCYEEFTVVVPPATCPVDPQGYIYCEETGEIITGGTIAVSGPGDVVITLNGTSGQYQFYTDGTPGTYTITYTPPPGYSLSTSHLPAGTLDPTGQPSPYAIGSPSTDGLVLDDFSAAANPFYLMIEFEAGDPEIELNNIPLSGCECQEVAEAGTGQTICSTATVDLTALGASVTPGTLGATWSTSGTGTFDDTNAATGAFGVATTYTPSAADVEAGQVVLTLTTDDPGIPGCEPVSDDVLILILQVDCGAFPWDGSN